MSKTRHIQSRMSQRAISQAVVDLVLSFGTPGHNGKVVLNRKSLNALDHEIRELRHVIDRARQKGGVVVVEDRGSLITTYRLDSYSYRAASAA